jgi:hypothetical protein
MSEKILADNLFRPVGVGGEYQIIERPTRKAKQFEEMVIYTRRFLPNGGVKLFMRDRKKRNKVVIVLTSKVPFTLGSGGKSFTLRLSDT